MIQDIFIICYLSFCSFFQQRKNAILECSNALAKSVNGHIIMKMDLLDEVVQESILIYLFMHQACQTAKMLIFNAIGRKSCRITSSGSWKIQGKLFRASKRTFDNGQPTIFS